MLKKTETEETLGFFCHIFIISSISIGGEGGLPATESGEIFLKFLFEKNTNER